MTKLSSQLKRTVFFLFLLVLSILLYVEFVPAPADAIVLNARIYTMDADNSTAEAMAVRAGRIVSVGSSARIQRRFRSSNLVDAGGKTVLPGLIDAHAHFVSLGIARLTVDLDGTSSEAEAAQRVRARAAKSSPGQWIRGRGWDQNDWDVKQFPGRGTLDAVSPNNPVILSRIDGHAIWVNTKAMELAGIGRETTEPFGGKILRNQSGNPSGVFVDNAKDLITKFVPPPTSEDLEEAVELAQQECLSYGLTSVHDMGVNDEQVALFKRMIDSQKLHLRLYAAIGGLGETWEEFKKSGPLIGYGDNHLTIRALKMYVDGALGSRGAALVEEYSDDAGNRGLTVTSESEFQTAVDQALAAGFQVCTHAIGDRGNNIALNIYERALKQHPVADARLRIEHAQVLLHEDIARFAALGVVPSMQPTHCTSDMYWAETRLGPKRILNAYAWRSLLNTGTKILGGSDFPVESANPLFGIYAAVTRQDRAGIPARAEDIKFFQRSGRGVPDSSEYVDGWFAAQDMTRNEAVRAFTTWAAWGSFEESLKGSLEKGKLADFIILSRDIFTIPANQIWSTRVEATFVGGAMVYRANPSIPN